MKGTKQMEHTVIVVFDDNSESYVPEYIAQDMECWIYSDTDIKAVYTELTS